MSSLIYLNEIGYLRNQLFSKHRFNIRKSLVPYEYRQDLDRYIIAKSNILSGEEGK